MPADSRTQAWAPVLEHIERTLSRADQDLEHHEAQLKKLADDARPEWGAWREHIQAWTSQLEMLDAIVARAAVKTAETDAALRDREEALRRWLETVRAVR